VKFLKVDEFEFDGEMNSGYLQLQPANTMPRMTTASVVGFRLRIIAGAVREMIADKTMMSCKRVCK
jgi:hypothetical protein